MTVLHIYTRVSTEIQAEDGSSLASQEGIGTRKAEDLGMEPRVWREGGQSSARDDAELSNRPVLRALLSEVDAGRVQHLFVYNTDRLARSDIGWTFIKAKLVQQGVTLHTQHGQYQLDDPTNKLILGLMATFSSYDNDLRADRTRLGKLDAVRDGRWHGGPPPYGYKISDRQLVPEEREQRWVREILERFAQGEPVAEIRDWLLSEGVRTRRGKAIWSLGSINALASNTHYAGYYYYRDKKSGERVRCSVPPIVSSTLFDAVQKERQRRSAQRRVRESGDQHFFLLRDFLVCGQCGSRLSGRIYEKQNRSVYYCPRHERAFANGKSRTKRCANRRYLKIEPTDELVWTAVIETLKDSNLYRELIKKEVLAVHDEDAKADAAEVKRLKKRLRSTDKDIEQADKGIVSLEATKILGVRSEEEIKQILAEVEERRLQLNAQREEIKEQLDARVQRGRWVDWVSQFGDRLEKMEHISPSEQKQVLKKTVTKIVVHTLDKQSHRLEIHFTTPMVKDRLVWNDPSNKSKGYHLQEGDRAKTIPIQKKQ